MTTVFSMNYLPPITSGQTDLDYHNLLFEIEKNNEVMRNFDYLNYDIINFQTNGFIKQKYTYGDHTFCEQEESSQSKFEKTLLRTTILRYLANQIVLNADRQSILCGFEKISSQGEKFENPVFVYMHLRLPHPPHIFGPNGEFVIGSKALTEEGSFVDEGKYVDSIKFANKKTIQVVDDILKHNKKSIIIIQSDHGIDVKDWGLTDKESDNFERHRNLIAIYFPNEKYDLVYDGLTPVNLFRLVFNTVHGDNYPFVDDTLYYSPFAQPYNFTDVTKILK